MSNLNTASQVISFTKKLEDESIEFYERLAAENEELNDMFSSFAKENKNFKKRVSRAYYSVISDALEGGFAFDTNPEDFKLDTDISDEDSNVQILEKSLRLENKIQKFYQEAADFSGSLMADVSRAFQQVAKKRMKRIKEIDNKIDNLKRSQ